MNNIKNINCNQFTIEEYINDFLPWLIKNDYTIHPNKYNDNKGKSANEIIEEYYKDKNIK